MCNFFPSHFYCFVALFFFLILFLFLDKMSKLLCIFTCKAVTKTACYCIFKLMLDAHYLWSWKIEIDGSIIIFAQIFFGYWQPSNFHINQQNKFQSYLYCEENKNIKCAMGKTIYILERHMHSTNSRRMYPKFVYQSPHQRQIFRSDTGRLWTIIWPPLRQNPNPIRSGWSASEFGRMFRFFDIVWNVVGAVRSGSKIFCVIDF